MKLAPRFSELMDQFSEKDKYLSQFCTLVSKHMPICVPKSMLPYVFIYFIALFCGCQSAPKRYPQ
ncbi:MAG TPA: hypothetical protein VGO47_01805, partial [Chlamydiales bacterium]|nr:hypothetical protein [Chlamydiales bacterium]